MSRRKHKGGCSCGAAGCLADQAPAEERQNATTGRYSVERGPDRPESFARSFDRNYDVQAFTGYPTSTVPAGQWARGTLLRSAQPVVMLGALGPMYDPTDPATWRPGL